MKFLHYGKPTKEKLEDKEYIYVEPIKLFVTNGDSHEFKLQYTWAEPDSPLPEIVRTQNHIAIEVENIDEAIKAYDEIVFEPVQAKPTVKLGFALKEGTLFELMEITSK